MRHIYIPALAFFSIFLVLGCHHWDEKGYPGDLEITSTPYEHALVGKTWRYQVDAKTTLQTSITFTLIDCSSGMTLSASGMLTWTPEEDQLGWNYAAVEVSDGQNVKTQYMEIDVDYPGETNHPPVITSRPVTEAEAGQQYAYDVNVTDIDDDGVSFELAHKGDESIQINASTGVITWTPGESVIGTGVRVVVVASDDASPGQGFDEQDFTVYVSASPGTPVIYSPAGVSAHAGFSYEYPVVAVDPGGDAITYSLAIAPAGMTVGYASGLVTWNPDNGDMGNHAVILRATDGEYTASQNFTVQVFGPGAPRFNTMPSTVVQENETWTYVPGVEYVGNGSVTLSLETAPSGMSLDAVTDQIEWTPPPGGDAFVPVVVVASDGEAVVRQSFTLRVTSQD